MTSETHNDEGGVYTHALRRCLGRFATGVAVVTTRYQGIDRGITVNSFASVSLDPPLILWCLGRKSGTYEAFTAAEHFIVNILAADQVTVSNHFAFRSQEEFPADVPFTRAVADVPLIEGTCAHLQCRRTEMFDGGDHVVLVGEVIDFAASDRPGLVYRAGQYAVAEPHPSAVAQSQDNLGQGFVDTTLRPALEGITRRFESFFGAELLEAGISARESQVLGLLLSGGAPNREEIANLTLVSGSFLDEALESLIGKGLVAQEQDGYRLTEHGQAFASEWFDRLRSYQSRALGSITPEEAEALQRKLARLSEWVDAAASGPQRSGARRRADS